MVNLATWQVISNMHKRISFTMKFKGNTYSCQRISRFEKVARTLLSMDFQPPLRHGSKANRRGACGRSVRRAREVVVEVWQRATGGK